MRPPGAAATTRLAIVGAVLMGGLVAGVGVGAARAVATPASGTEITFQVPDQEAAAATTKLEVTFPADHPIAAAAAQPVPGWHITVDTARPAGPVSRIIWSGGVIEPDTFADFVVSLNPPPGASRLVFHAVQTYDNGSVVRWVGTAEPERSTPTVTLRLADPVVHVASLAAVSAASDSGFGALGVLGGLVIGVVAIALASLALRHTRARQ